MTAFGFSYKEDFSYVKASEKKIIERARDLINLLRNYTMLLSAFVKNSMLTSFDI